MTILTLSTAIAVIYGLVSRRYERALAIGAITPAGAAVVAGGEAVPTFYAVALGGLGLLSWQWFARRGAPANPRLTQIPGIPLLLLLFAWSVIVVVVSPMLFPGLYTVTENQTLVVAGDLAPSNFAQLIYLALSIVVVVLVARSATTGPGLLAIPLGVGIGLTFWRYLSVTYGVPFPEGVLDNSPGFKYIETAPGGGLRFRGITTEPAALAMSAAAAAAYFLSYAAALRGWRRAASIAIAAIAIQLGLVSTSATFLVVGAALAALAVGAFVWRVLSPRFTVSPRALLIALGAVGVGLIALPALVAQFTSLVDEKVSSSSFTDRSWADTESFKVFVETWGIGLGLGNVRASSLVYTLLGAVGVVGAILFVGAVLSIALPALGLTGYAPVMWALTATFIGKAISSPGLSDSSGVLWLGLGILAHGLLAAGHGTGTMLPRRAAASASGVPDEAASST
ncbi:hypothetical protein [Demequina sp. NBRC 110054]|uniref:hypothetical protein n=1 Tax=Demequina sp. NBRC 110054 TaxID=1570343 RepID=UPI000A0100CE|nr:hypothetical protein [Demequina sp. NBRC 110054]